MRRASIIACAVAAVILGDVTPSHARCRPYWFRWVAPLELPPDATVYLVSRQGYALDALCESGFFLRSRWEPEVDDATRHLRNTEDDVVVTAGEQVLPRIVDTRLVGLDVVLAVAVGSPSAPFTLEARGDIAPDGTWNEVLGYTARVHRIAARSPGWTIAAAATEVDGAVERQLVDRGRCAELRLRGAGVGYWVIETQGCLDRLVVPDEYGENETSLYVPPRCLGDRGSVDVVAHYFDGTSTRHRVRTDLDRDEPAGLRFGAAGALFALVLVLVRMRRRRPRGAMVPR